MAASTETPAAMTLTVAAMRARRLVIFTARAYQSNSVKVQNSGGSLLAENDPGIEHDAQVTPAHVLDAVNSFKTDVIQRLEAVEKTASASYDILKAAGILDGKGEELIQMVKERRASDRRSDAWRSVGSDIANWFRWLTPTRGWLKFLLAAAVGGAFTGWASGGHFHIPGL